VAKHDLIAECFLRAHNLRSTFLEDNSISDIHRTFLINSFEDLKVKMKEQFNVDDIVVLISAIVGSFSLTTKIKRNPLVILYQPEMFSICWRRMIEGAVSTQMNHHDAFRLDQESHQAVKR
jgi:hypothetical protein